MKTKLLLLTALLASAGFIQAQTTNFVTNPIIYIGGSQAFSALDNAALLSYATNNGYTPVAWAGTTTPTTKSKALLFRRQGAPVVRGNKSIVSLDIINVHQTGSEASLRSAAGNGSQLINFLPDNAVGQYADADASYTNQKPAAIGTSGVFQASSRWFAGAKEGGVKYKALTEVKPGSENGFAAQVWGWSASSNFPTNAANITSLTAQALLQQGNVPLSYFTGNPSDTNHGVWLIGRDIAAGARIAAHANVGYGTLSTVRQFRVYTNTGEVTLGIEPAATVDGVAVAQGNNGYNGTSSQATAAKTVLPANLRVDLGNGLTNSPYSGTNYLIQYNSYALTVNQTNSSGNPTLIPLRFNGVAPSIDGVLSGAYTYWTYEHLYVTPKPKNTNTLAVAQYVANHIANMTSAQLKTVSGSDGYLNPKELSIFRTSDSSRIFSK